MSNLEKNLWRQKKQRKYFRPISENDIHEFTSTTTSGNCDEANDEALIKEFEWAKQLWSVQDVYQNEKSSINFQTFYCPPKSESCPLLFCHHGAGSSAMSFWSLAHLASEELGFGIFAYDARGHGDSTRADSMSFDLQALSEDVEFVLEEFIKRHNPANTLCLVGHSLGGAVLCNFLSLRFDAFKFLNLGGFVVIDIVEEMAVRALMSTEAFFQRMPNSFGSYSEVVQWHMDSRLLYNYDSAKVSVCHLVERNAKGRLVWKCDLPKLPLFWGTWFSNMSKKFIESTNGSISKLLLLSTNDTLDKDLMIGQMQGKYQLVVFNNASHVGHFLHEDIPRQLMMSILDFVRRIELAKKLKLDNPWKKQTQSTSTFKEDRV